KYTAFSVYLQKIIILDIFMNFLNITGNEGKTTVLEEIIKAVIILKNAFIIPELLVNFIGK
ncbi:hypothetical protein ACWCPJ_39660, partial [Streptomyces collinus]